MQYIVTYSADARADLRKLEKSTAERIIKKIVFWSSQPNPLHFSKPLKGAVGKYRFRVGDYRIIFKLDKSGNLIILFILVIRHRREIYRV